MDYKEEYQKALERAKKGLPIDEVFPELKESEDERIREQIVQVLIEHDWSVTYKVRRGDCIAWLEKQKERERIVPEREATDFEIEIHEIIAQARSDKRLADKDVLEQFEREAACALMWKAEKQLRNAEKKKEQKPVPKFRVGDYVKDTNYKGAPLYQIVGIDKECYICEYRGDKAMGDRAVMHFTFDNPYLRLEPQPVEWGEEDEKIYDEALDALYYKDCNDKDDVLSALKGLCDLIADKRKVIPPYQRWKPSEEQIEALEWMLTTVSMKDGGRGVVLKKLINDLKKQM